MMRTRRFLLGCALAALALVGLSLPSAAADALRVGTLKFGTVNWLMDTLQAEKLDAKEGLTIERLELATNQAGTIALQAGEVDLIVSDWFWAMRQRSEGDPLLFAPYSSALGALMVPKDKGIKGIEDLKGRKIGVAGSALDKSWLLIRAYSRGKGGDVATVAEPVYAAPPLLSEQLKLGRLDAVLTFWNFAARLNAEGFSRAIDVADVMAELGISPQPPLVGFVWRESLMATKRPQVEAFFRAVVGANEVLRTSDAAWDRIKPEMRAESDAAFQRLKEYFRAGIPGPWGEAETRSAQRLYDILAGIGGSELVGPRTHFDTALFWAPKN